MRQVVLCVNKWKYSPRLGLLQNQPYSHFIVLHILLFPSSMSYGQLVNSPRDKGSNYLTLWSWHTPSGLYTRVYEDILGYFLSNICYLAWLPQASHSAPAWLVSWQVVLSASNKSLYVTSLYYHTSGACLCWSIIKEDQENCIWKKSSSSGRLFSSNGSVHSWTTRISWWGF